MTMTFYTPTEYEEMLLAAAWVNIEFLDPDYEAYIRSDPDAMTYAQWIETKREWNEAHQRFAELQDEYGIEDCWIVAETEINHLCDTMQRCEWLLNL